MRYYVKLLTILNLPGKGEVSVEVQISQALPLAVRLAVEVSAAWQAFRKRKEEMFSRGCARMTLCILH